MGERETTGKGRATRRLGGLVTAAVLAGCATTSGGAPRQDTGRIAIESIGVQNVELYTPQSQYEEVIAATEADVWPHLEPAFEGMGVEVTEVKADQWIAGNPRFRPRRIQGDRLSTFLECGNDHGGPYADQRDVQMTFMAQLLRAPGGGTNVTVLVTGVARPRNVSGADLPCSSKGVLEKRLVAELQAAVAGGRDP